MVIPVMWVLEAIVLGGLVVASVAARRGAKRLERVCVPTVDHHIEHHGK